MKYKVTVFMKNVENDCELKANWMMYDIEDIDTAEINATYKLFFRKNFNTLPNTVHIDIEEV